MSSRNDPPPRDTPTVHGPRQDLQGWKEIAAYLGKSVRAAQRWERDLNLPVRRIRTAAGQAIYAKPEEIDRWRTDHEVAATNASDGGDAVPRVAAVTMSSRSGRVAFAFLGVAAVVLSGVAAWLPEPSIVFPERLALTERALEARNASGDLLWRHDFGARLYLRSRNGAHPDRPDRVYTADIDGDGEREIYATISYDLGTGASDALFCFAPDGAVRWKYQPDYTMTFQGGRYTGPWVINDVALGPLADGRQELWVSFAHHLWWPSTVVRVDMSGRAERKFTQSGTVYSLRWWRAGGRDYVLAGGVNNDYAAAALAVLDPSAGSSVSPQPPDSPYACTDCDAEASPVRYFLLPRSDVSIASGYPYNRVAAIELLGQEAQFMTDEDPHVSGANRIFQLLPSFEFRDTSPGDGFWVAHRKHEHAGKIGHAAEACPLRVSPVELRAWTAGSGWQKIAAPTGASLIPGGASD